VVAGPARVKKIICSNEKIKSIAIKEEELSQV
jgi:hypothetical protein